MDTVGSTPLGVTIRVCDLRDAADLEPLIAELLAVTAAADFIGRTTGPTTEVGRRYLQMHGEHADARKQKAFLAERDGRAVGLAIGWVNDQHGKPCEPGVLPKRIGTVSDVVVSPDDRGEHIGTRLMTELETWFRDEGCDYVALSVFAENPAKAFYERIGYNPYIVRMVKRLA